MSSWKDDDIFKKIILMMKVKFFVENRELTLESLTRL